MYTSWGLYFDITTFINPNWSSYDQSVARAHMLNWNKIIINEYGCPIDNEYEIEGIEEEYGYLFS